jgi:Zn finger protein HypA/HybF involved in hydrogenase expression
MRCAKCLDCNKKVSEMTTDVESYEECKVCKSKNIKKFDDGR